MDVNRQAGYNERIMSGTAASRPPHNLIVVPRRDLSLDFANTLAWRGSAPAESLHNTDDLLAWIAAAKALPERAVGELRKWFAAHPAQSATVFGAAIELRETLYQLLRSRASVSPPAREDLRRLNSALSDAPPRAILDRAGNGCGWRIEAKPTVAGILAPVLWSVADILVGADSARVRQCANDRCLWLFLDDSKNGTRRWCSMQACGNRAKAHRHYLRQKEQ
jgi:predicted RNA-binding Zn ribbon-like protein